MCISSFNQQNQPNETGASIIKSPFYTTLKLRGAPNHTNNKREIVVLGKVHSLTPTLEMDKYENEQ